MIRQYIYDDVAEINSLLGWNLSATMNHIMLLGIKLLRLTDPKIHEAKINQLLPEPRTVACEIGRDGCCMDVLVIRTNPDDNEYIYRHMQDIMDETFQYTSLVKDITELYNGNHTSRFTFSDSGSGGCYECESCYDAAPLDEKGTNAYLLCVKDNQGVGIHPDFPCALHKFKEKYHEP